MEKNKAPKIFQKESPVLREISKSVPVEKINTPKTKKVIKDMKNALASQDDGVAIAAPQIGVPLRIFIVSKRVEEIMFEEKNKGKDEGGKPTAKNFQDAVFINPVIKKLSKEKNTVEEGCLSVRYLYGKVERSKKVFIEAYDEKGKKFSSGGSGLIAQIFQHEVDHLDGILFIDKAKFVEEVLPQNAKK